MCRQVYNRGDGGGGGNGGVPCAPLIAETSEGTGREDTSPVPGLVLILLQDRVPVQVVVAASFELQNLLDQADQTNESGEAQ